MNNQFAIPGAIIIAGLLIAGAVIYTQQPPTQAGTADRQPTNTNEIARPAGVAELRPVSADDHLFGNPTAPIVVIEYSDTECPFCKRFHTTMHDIIDEYDGQVAWVYRHFPLPSLHPQAPEEARSSECVANLGGNDAFWTYIDTIYEQTPANDSLDLALLPEFAELAGIAKDDFIACMADTERFADRVKADRDNAIAIGGTGTPFTVIVAGEQTMIVNGAETFERMKSRIDSFLDQLGI